MANALEQLKKMTTVVADIGDINAIKTYTPTDATTNPSLIYSAAQIPDYKNLIDDAIAFGYHMGTTEKERLTKAVDKCFVNFGIEILDIVPRYVSTEVDARLSFNAKETVNKAREIIGMYEQAGVGKDRILIKIAATWEGVQAAKILQKEGIRCNMTLLFGFGQAVACAQAGVFLISPFVGRIMDWYKAKEKRDRYSPEEDPGVKSVKRIYEYYKKYGHETLIMGASFRNINQIKALAGCDLLTISPRLLELLQSDNEPISRMLVEKDAKNNCMDEQINIDENTFRWLLNEDAMATELLTQGIRRFSDDIVKLENLIKPKLKQYSS